VFIENDPNAGHGIPLQNSGRVTDNYVISTEGRNQKNQDGVPGFLVLIQCEDLTGVSMPYIWGNFY
jgi:hypothetical protein